MTPHDLIPAIHIYTPVQTFWFYDRPGGGVVIYGEPGWPSFSQWMVC
jgi:hypothetical protein